MDLKKAIDETARLAKKMITEEQQHPVLKYQSKSEFQALIDFSLKDKGCSERAFFESLEKIILLTPKTNSRSFFNQLFAGRSAPSLSAELLTCVLNTTMHTYKVAGIQVFLEQEVLGQMLRKVGYEKGEGVMNPGGSLSNMLSMMVARNEKESGILEEGLSGQKLIAYTSVEAHYSVKKNAAFLGIGKNNVRFIESDSRGRMNTKELENQIKADLSENYIPFYINATAGTTVFGAFDPFVEIAKIAKQYGLWFHIDAALGGSVLMSERHRKLLEGSALSDSCTWNAHKMMNVPITASFLLMKQKGLLQKHLSEKADYLFQDESEELDLGNISMQCGRRVDGFKVWAHWKYFGSEGIERRINHLFDLAQYAADYIKKDPLFDLFQAPESINVCFTVKGGSPEDICSYLHREGMAMVGYCRSKGNTFIRMACINADLEIADINHFFLQLKKAVKAVSNAAVPDL